MKPGNRSYIRYLKSISNASYSNTKVMDIWEVNKKIQGKWEWLHIQIFVCINCPTLTWYICIYQKYLFKQNFARLIPKAQILFATRIENAPFIRIYNFKY